MRRLEFEFRQTFGAKLIFHGFEAQKIKFLCLFGRENLKMCEKFGAKIWKFTKNGAKMQKIIFFGPKIYHQN